MEKAYGGIIINEQGLVLLREPTNHHDRYVWTFAKGKPDPGESAEETALREVLEETGIKAKIIAKIPGSFDGSTTSNEYFLMVPAEDTGKFHWETHTVAWVTAKEAVNLISMTKNPKGRARDLKLLEAAVRLSNELNPRPSDSP
jgi:8-oxo-dGTP pyrophosphatase MutT (NUDIX family)